MASTATDNVLPPLRGPWNMAIVESFTIYTPGGEGVGYVSFAHHHDKHKEGNNAREQKELAVLFEKPFFLSY